MKLALIHGDTIPQAVREELEQLIAGINTIFTAQHTPDGLHAFKALPLTGRGAMTAPTISSGTGSPETRVEGYNGDLYLRLDGGAATTLYVKTSTPGAVKTRTGWTAK